MRFDRAGFGELRHCSFERGTGIIGFDSALLQITEAAQTMKELERRETALEGQRAVHMRASEQVLHDEHIGIERGREIEAVVSAFPAFAHTMREENAPDV